MVGSYGCSDNKSDIGTLKKIGVTQCPSPYYEGIGIFYRFFCKIMLVEIIHIRNIFQTVFYIGDVFVNL